MQSVGVHAECECVVLRHGGQRAYNTNRGRRACPYLGQRHTRDREFTQPQIPLGLADVLHVCDGVQANHGGGTRGSVRRDELCGDVRLAGSHSLARVREGGDEVGVYSRLVTRQLDEVKG